MLIGMFATNQAGVLLLAILICAIMLANSAGYCAEMAKVRVQNKQLVSELSFVTYTLVDFVSIKNIGNDVSALLTLGNEKSLVNRKFGTIDRYGLFWTHGIGNGFLVVPAEKRERVIWQFSNVNIDVRAACYDLQALCCGISSIYEDKGSVRDRGLVSLG